MGKTGLNQWSEDGDVRCVTGKRENKIEVGESRTKSVVRRRDVREITGKRENKNGSWGEQD